MGAFCSLKELATWTLDASFAKVLTGYVDVLKADSCVDFTLHDSIKTFALV